MQTAVHWAAVLASDVCSSNFLRHQPLVLFHTVQGNKRQQNGDSLDVVLIFRIIAVVLVLTDFQSSGATEHNEDDAHVAHEDHSPLADAGILGVYTIGANWDRTAGDNPVVIRFENTESKGE